jgi:hypothetical protein
MHDYASDDDAMHRIFQEAWAGMQYSMSNRLYRGMMWATKTLHQGFHLEFLC